jgi:hypothetical protein
MNVVLGAVQGKNSRAQPTAWLRKKLRRIDSTLWLRPPQAAEAGDGR